MPRATRKRKIDLVPEASTRKRALPAVVVSLAAEYELDLEMLLDWKVYPSGKVVLIAPNGMKLVREVALETTPDKQDPNACDGVEETAQVAVDGVPACAGGAHE